MNNMERSDGKFFPIETESDLTLYIFQPAYKEYVCTSGMYIRNTVTGEDCGQHVVLCKHVNNIDGTINENPYYDPDTYEVLPKSIDS